MSEHAARILFLRRGSFSHINASVLAQLRLHFPQQEIVDADLGAEWDYSRTCLTKHTVFFFRNVLAARLQFRNALGSGKLTLRNAFNRTTTYGHTVRKAVLKRFAGTKWAFTFQTQSLFDAHLPDVPHFVFTDHTHLANIQYPAFDRSLLASTRWLAAERALYHSAERVFTMAEHVRRSCLADYGMPADRVVTVNGGSNLGPPSPLQNDDYTNGTIVFIGVDWERKGGPALATAFARVREKLPNARLVIVGCRPTIAAEGVEIVGRIPAVNVSTYLAKASVFCLPSRIEPFGIAPIEAALHRLPCVVTDIGALPEIVKDGETGYVVKVDDVPALTNALTGLLSNPALCRRFGEAGEQHIRAVYDWDHVGALLHKSIESALR